MIRRSSAAFDPARNPMPQAWTIRTNGNASSEGDSRSQMLRSVLSSQAVKCMVACLVNQVSLRRREIPFRCPAADHATTSLRRSQLEYPRKSVVGKDSMSWTYMRGQLPRQESDLLASISLLPVRKRDFLASISLFLVRKSDFPVRVRSDDLQNRMIRVYYRQRR